MDVGWLVYHKRMLSIIIYTSTQSNRVILVNNDVWSVKEICTKNKFLFLCYHENESHCHWQDISS